MTEKAQRELYFAIRKTCDFCKDNQNDYYFFGALANALSDLLTAPQFKLSQLEKFKFLEE